MKVTALVVSKSGRHTLAFNTDPPLSEAVFIASHMGWVSDPLLKQYSISWEKGSLLLHSAQSFLMTVPPGLVKVIEGVLSEAERSVAQDGKPGESVTRHLQQDKDRAIEIAKELKIAAAD